MSGELTLDEDAPKVSTTLGLVTFWGSDCRRCGNTTPASMCCDECGKDDETFALLGLELSGRPPRQRGPVLHLRDGAAGMR